MLSVFLGANLPVTTLFVVIIPRGSHQINQFQNLHMKELFPDKVKLRVRFSLDNLKLDDDMLNIPLFMADQTDRLIGLALEQRTGRTE